MNFLEKIKKSLDFDDFDDYDEFFDDDDYIEDDMKNNSTKESLRHRLKKKDENVFVERKPFMNRKITPIVQKKSAPNVCILKPTTYNDAVDVSDALMSGRAIVLNLENLEIDIAQRIVDFATGACVVLDGSFKSISNHVFVITPNNIDINGGVEDLLLNNFGIEK